MQEEDKDKIYEAFLVEFPLSLLKNELNTKSIQNAICYSIHKASKDVDYNMEIICEYTVRNYYEQFYNFLINGDIKKYPRTHIGYRVVFEDVTDEEMDEMMEIFESNKDIQEKAIEYYQVSVIQKHLGLTGIPAYIIHKSMEIYTPDETHGDEQMIKIDISSMLHFDSGLGVRKNK